MKHSASIKKSQLMPDKQIPSFLLLLITVVMWSCAGGASESFKRYEAEAGTFTNMIPLPDPNASGGKYLSIEEASHVLWEVPVSQNGYYQVKIRYRSPGGDNMQYLLKNEEEIGIGFDMAEDWNIFSQSFYLDSGKNSLGILDGWGGMDIDWMTLEMAEPEYGITPASNLYYLKNQRKLVFKVDHYQKEISQVKLNGRKIGFLALDFPYQEHAGWLCINDTEFSNLKPGNYDLQVQLEQEEIQAQIVVQKEPEPSDLLVITPDVEHGSSMLLRLPGEKYMLIDCGKAWVRDSILIPMFERHGIDSIHTLILTHYHRDHDGGDSGKVIRDKFHVQTFIDYNTFPTGHAWEQDGVHFRVLNSYTDGGDENSRSLSLAISYKDFRLVHGGDTYAINQRMMLDRFPDEIPADVYYANHHFHGSVDPEYIISTDPDLVILQAQQAIYARAAYMVKYLRESEQVLNRLRKHPVETLPALEVGTIVLRINAKDKWTYETYRDQDNAIIPGL
jgi:beta-lactamase superfamily II metal-dependent hydrolase